MHESHYHQELLHFQTTEHDTNYITMYYSSFSVICNSDFFFFACGYCHNTFYLAHRNPKIWNDPNFCASSLIICALSRCVWIAEIFVHLTTMHISSHVSCHVFLCWRQAVIYQGSNQLGHTGVLHKRGTESHCLGNELGNYWYSLNGVSNLFSLWMYCSILWA